MDESGGRARNAWAICPQAGDNIGKPVLIPNVVICRMAGGLKSGNLRVLALEEEPVSYQLVGEVTAHQGYDG